MTSWEVSGIALSAAAFLLVRLPLYADPGLRLGWHSDAALIGLMARALAEGDYPLLYWACDYVAPLTSVFAAALGTSILPNVGPLALRLGLAIEVIAALILFHAALRRSVGRRAALLATFWTSAGPAFYFKLTYAPLSAEGYFFLSALLLWYVTRTRFVRLHQWLIFGLLTGAGFWIHRGVLFVVVPALLVILWYDREFWPRFDLGIAAAVFAAGVFFGYVPAIVGRYHLDQRLYIPVKPGWRLSRVPSRVVETVTQDFWTLIGADTTPWKWLIGAAMVVLLGCAVVRAIRHFEPRRETVLAVGVVAVSLAFWMFSTQAYLGALRYIVIAVPILYAFAAREVVAFWDGHRRVLSAAVAVTIAVALFIPRRQEVAEIVAGRSERFEHWPGDFDPRPALQRIAEDGYVVCYADVWVAHKFEWLSESGVRFIPHRSVNRRMVESLRLAALPGRKCFVDLEGNVRDLSPQEQAALRLETLWHVRGEVRNARLR